LRRCAMRSLLEPSDRQRQHASLISKGVCTNQHYAGLLTRIFGLVNICARTAGGLMFDVIDSYSGIRGRIWALFLQTLVY
jgi:hypothetical protein